MPGGALPPRIARGDRPRAGGWLIGCLFAAVIVGTMPLANGPVAAATVGSGAWQGGTPGPGATGPGVPEAGSWSGDFAATFPTMSYTASGAGWQLRDSRTRLPELPSAGIPGSGPCHWKHDAFGSPGTFPRCGYPARLAAGGGEGGKLRWWFGGHSYGGGGGGSGKAGSPGLNPPIPGPGPGPNPNPGPSPAPVPLPAAGWLLLAALALPRLLRRG